VPASFERSHSWATSRTTSIPLSSSPWAAAEERCRPVALAVDDRHGDPNRVAEVRLADAVAMFCVSPGGTAPPLYVNTRSSLMSDWSTAESIYMATRRAAGGDRSTFYGRLRRGSMSSDPVRVGVLSLHNSKETKAICNAVEDLGHEPVWLREENAAISVEDGDGRCREPVVIIANRLLLSNTDQPAELLGLATTFERIRPMLNEPKRGARVNPQVRHGGDARRLEHPRAGRAARAVERPAQRGARASARSEFIRRSARTAAERGRSTSPSA